MSRQAVEECLVVVVVFVLIFAFAIVFVLVEIVVIFMVDSFFVVVFVVVVVIDRHRLLHLLGRLSVLLFGHHSANRLNTVLFVVQISHLALVATCKLVELGLDGRTGALVFAAAWSAELLLLVGELAFVVSTCGCCGACGGGSSGRRRSWCAWCRRRRLADQVTDGEAHRVLACGSVDSSRFAAVGSIESQLHARQVVVEWLAVFFVKRERERDD